jgi:RimJ/RimL family protein N-acetyltransferase
MTDSASRPASLDFCQPDGDGLWVTAEAPGWALLDRLFVEQDAAWLALPVERTAALAPRCWQGNGERAWLTRRAFYELREPWLAPALLPVSPAVDDPHQAHPPRPRDPAGEHYRRYLPTLGKTISLRLIDVDEDGERFHRWQNDPRVAAFWEYPFERPALDDMIRQRLADPHCTPLIAAFDDEPFGYFEGYWVAEDRLAPYCDHDPFDQGIHVLVGETTHLGVANTVAWLNALAHYLFLREPRCERLFGEPRHDNRAMLRYTKPRTAWEKRHEFDFPHKRSMLLCCERETFFQGLS